MDLKYHLMPKLDVVVALVISHAQVHRGLLEIKVVLSLELVTSLGIPLLLKETPRIPRQDLFKS